MSKKTVEIHIIIPNFEDYTCTYDGEIYRWSSTGVQKLKVYNAKNGYCTIQLYTPSRSRVCNYGVHTIVASAWYEKPKAIPDKGSTTYIVNHKNCNKRDNRVSNLEYVTHSENALHARHNGIGVKGRPVCQSTSSGKFIAEYKSIIEAARATGINQSSICATCLHKKGRETAGGFLWVYAEEYVKDKPKGKHGRCRGVNQYSMDGKLLKKFSSLNDAANEVKCSYTNISAVCNGNQKSAKGFIWKYAPVEKPKIDPLIEEVKNWAILAEFPRYRISRDGRVYSVLYNRIMKGSRTEEGRHYITATNSDGILKTVAVYRLVAKAYLPNPNNYKLVNHLDGDPSNNKVENLEWCTYSRNSQHAFDTGINSCTVSIIQMDLKGNELRTFRSIAEACRSLDKTRSAQSAIQRVMKGERLTAYGYKWKRA